MIDADAIADVVVARLTPQLRALASEAFGLAAAAPLLDVAELARILGVSVVTVRRAKDAGMPHHFIGTALRFDLAACRTWFSTHGRRRLGKSSALSTTDIPLAGVARRHRRRRAR